MSRRRRRTYRSAGEAARRRHSWLELLGTSGPFLTLPVVDRVFPDGLPAVAAAERTRVRVAVAAMLDDGGVSRHAVIEMLLGDVLGWREQLLLDSAVPASLAEAVVEYGQVLRPGIAFASPVGRDVQSDAGDGDEAGEDGDDSEAPPVEAPFRLIGMVTAWGGHPLERTASGGWTASPAERLAVLLRARDVPIGLVTDGRWWALVWAPRGRTTGVAVWDAGLFSEEPDSLRAFVALLGRARFLGVAPGETLPALLDESVEAQEEVTETLGRQVRAAVELFVRTVDSLDADSGGALLADVDDDELYAGAVTVLMRIVFCLFAEDRRLLPSDDAIYLAGYSVARLVEQLEQRAQLAGEAALEHRTGAWHRLLATARALHGGVAHEDLRLPPYGGGLFDPGAHPWLEAADRVDDRTVLRMLRAVQYVDVGGERRRLTFRALDVEQIGYVYEGLLESEVRTATEVTVSVKRSSTGKGGKEPSEVTISELAAWLNEVPRDLAGHLTARTTMTASAIERGLAKRLDDADRAALLRATYGDVGLTAAIMPVAPVVHWHDEGVPAVTLPGRRFVAPSTRRATTGTHYTPRSLAEEVAAGALEPLVYRPGPLQVADRAQWILRPSSEIEKLRVADIAMGSGAFLVAACRYLADRLVQAWQAEGQADALRAAAATAGRGRGRLDADAEVEQVTLAARRVVAERCLYGVDINPLAVEMAKLSLWLVTMDTERPFGFVDDRLVAGDSLLGLTDPEQLRLMHIDPSARARISQAPFETGRLERAADIRRQITATPVVSARDVEHKQKLLRQALADTDHLSAIADAVTGVGLRMAKVRNARQLEAEFAALWLRVGLSDPSDADAIRADARKELDAGLPEGQGSRYPLHWPVVFPEVFADSADPGFDAVIGNPPFLGGQKMSGAMGDDYLAWLQRWDGNGVKGSADLAARFVLRANKLLNSRGQLGFVTTNTIVQGDTLEVGLGQVASKGLTVRRGVSSHPWPSASASLEIVEVWASRAPVTAKASRILDGEEVPTIGADLEPVGRVAGRPFRLSGNDDKAFIGSYVLGLGFTLTHEQAVELIARDPRNADCLQPYVIGQDLNQRPDHSASRWIINFRDWPLARAEQYPALIDIVRRLVKPERDQNNRANYRDRWWIHAENRPGLYAAIADLDHVLALSRVGNAIIPVRVSTGPVFSEATVVLALDGFADLAMLSSSVHTTWTIRYTSTMRTDIRYAPSDVFFTLPRPANTPELAKLGEDLDSHRRELMLSRSWGLTTTYNHVHSTLDRDPEVVRLREIHEAIDHAVLAAYGWSDLDPQIGHHATKIGTRWTVSRDARFELLDRLLEENHRRRAAETDG